MLSSDRVLGAGRHGEAVEDIDSADCHGVVLLSIPYGGGTVSGSSSSCKVSERERKSSVREGDCNAPGGAVCFLVSDVAGGNVACIVVAGIG